MSHIPKWSSYILWFLVFVGLFISPWFFLNQKLVSVEVEKKIFGDVTVIFGTRVTNDEISPLLQERLEMGIRLYEGNKTNKLILSNTEQASFIMKKYVTARGVPEADIILDMEARMTRQSCETHIVQNSESILFVSQSFHLPRIYYECKKLGVHGHLVPAEYSGAIDRSQTSLYQILTIRIPRYIREMVILWGDIIFQKFVF